MTEPTPEAIPHRRRRRRRPKNAPPFTIQPLHITVASVAVLAVIIGVAIVVENRPALQGREAYAPPNNGAAVVAATSTATVTATATVEPTATHTLPPPSPAATFTATVPTPTATRQPTPTPSPVPPVVLTAIARQCAQYTDVQRLLLTRVDRDVLLPRDYLPEDLQVMPLNPGNVFYGSVQMRKIVQQPLLDMLDAMNQAGLKTIVISGYRSFADQTLAYEQWLRLFPDRAPQLSAVPGHSEHQLGTAIDFSTPYMKDQYGDYFSKSFADTAEGLWLTKQAAYYGFTLSYPQWAEDVTGYEWEPWHFRYVGSLAQQLLENHVTLTEYIQKCNGGS